MITTNNTNNNTNTNTTTTGGLLEVVSCLPAGRGASFAPVLVVLVVVLVVLVMLLVVLGVVWVVLGVVLEQVEAVAKPLLRLLRRNHRQDHQNLGRSLLRVPPGGRTPPTI